jgi:hypothetical protein
MLQGVSGLNPFYDYINRRIGWGLNVSSLYIYPYKLAREEEIEGLWGAPQHRTASLSAG